MANGGTIADAIGAKAGPLLRDWANVTWLRDTAPVFGPVPRSAANWIVLAAWAIITYFFATAIPLYLAGFAAVAFLYTLGRATRTTTARRTLQAHIIDSTRQQAGHPRPTTSQPINPNALVTLNRWGRKNLPSRIYITLNGDSPAGLSPLSRGQLEAIIDKIPNPHTPTGGGWSYSIAKNGRLRADAVDATDPRLPQQREIAYLRNKFNEWFKLTDKLLKTYNYDLEIIEWTTLEHPQKGPLPVPAHIVFTYDGHNTSQPDFRDHIERACDTEVVRAGHIWVYDWSTSGQLEIRGAEPGSVAAQRKLSQRWVSDLVSGQVPRSKDTAVATITGWQEPAHGDPWVPIAFDTALGSGAFSNRRSQRAFEDAADEALTTTYPGLVWTFEWTVSATTSVQARAFPPEHVAALRKDETKRLRKVVDKQFGQRGNDCDIKILEWEPSDDETPIAQPARIRVAFGSMDVSKADTQLAFEAHFDSQFTTCDWNYEWRPDAGYVVLTSVPPLPEFLAFPDTGTPEFDRFLELAKQGKILFGPRRRGGEVIWDMDQIPHAIFGGQTGAGKSFAMGIPLLAALYLPESFECIVADPKKIDFTWTPEFPNVVRFGAEDDEIAACIQFTADQMEYRQQRCGRRNVRNLQELRDLYAQHPEFEAEDGPCPKRLMFFFDEIAEYMAKSGNKDIEEIKQAAKALLEKLSRLARALEINLVTAAQKPERSILGGQLDGQLGFRMCVGPVDTHTSLQIMWDNHGTMFPAQGNPKGRGWAYDSKDGYRMLQNLFLPNDTQQVPGRKGMTVEGIKDRVRSRLRREGYQRVMVPNQYRGKEPRWVFHGHPPDDPSSPVLDKARLALEKAHLGDYAHLPPHAVRVRDPELTPTVDTRSADRDGDDDWDDSWD